MKKRYLGFIILVVFIMVSIIFTGCSSKNTAESAPAEPSRSAPTTLEDAKVSEMPNTNRKLIVKLFMQMRVDDIEKSIHNAEAMALTAGGYVRESYQNESSGQLTIMIPAGSVDTFTDNLRNLGNIINSSRNTEDVTDSYFDTQVRIKNLEVEIETMHNLLLKSGWKVSEILEIEREIRRLTDELESLKGYITNLDRQITYSEVRISFEKSQIAIDTVNQDGIRYKLSLALKNGVDFLINIVTAIFSVIVFILPISPIIIIAYFIFRKYLNRLKGKDKKESKL